LLNTLFIGWEYLRREPTLEQEIAEFVNKASTNIGCMQDCTDVIRDWGPPHIFAPGAELFRQNKKPKTVYFIETGVVKLSRLTSRGARKIIGLRTKNWLLDLSAILRSRLHSFTAIALTECYLRTIDAGRFLVQMEKNPKFRQRIECVLSTEIQNFMQKVDTLTSLPAETRLKHLLLELITAQTEHLSHNPITLNIEIKHLEMGEIIDVTPEHLSRILKKMEAQELIRRSEKKLTIIDPQNLLTNKLS
jgi:CRP/FNR family transcriptional regulator